MSERRLTVDDGKYTFFVPPGDYRVHVHRYSEPWVIIEQGCNAVWALVAELIDSRALIAKVRTWAEACTTGETVQWTSYGPGASRHVAMVEAFNEYQVERGEPAAALVHAAMPVPAPEPVP